MHISKSMMPIPNVCNTILLKAIDGRAEFGVKLRSILEESGWKLKQEGDESSDDEESFELPSLGSYS